MKPTNIFQIWLRANLIIGFGFIAFVILKDGWRQNSLVECFGLFGLLFVFTIPSLITLWIFHHFYLDKKLVEITVPYVSMILLINFLYLGIIYLSSSFSLETKWIFYILFTTICGILSFFIEYYKVKKYISKIETEEIQ